MVVYPYLINLLSFWSVVPRWNTWVFSSFWKLALVSHGGALIFCFLLLILSASTSSHVCPCAYLATALFFNKGFVFLLFIFFFHLEICSTSSTFVLKIHKLLACRVSSLSKTPLFLCKAAFLHKLILVSQVLCLYLAAKFLLHIYSRYNL